MKEKEIMLPNLLYVYEEQIPPRPLTTLIGLNLKENQLLAELSEQAKTIAPRVGKALTTRIQEFASLNARYPISSTDMQLYLQDWFLQLFHCREEKYLVFHEYFLGIPQNLVITGIDIILTYGEEVVQHSPNPELAVLAFHKALALKIASDQLQSHRDDSQHYFEMLLLLD
jgi:hypothetical protein